MMTVRADKAKNLLTISFSGCVDPKEAERGLLEAEARVKDVESGFTLLADLTELEEMDPGCAPYIRKIMDRFAKHDIKKIVRVIPDPSKDIGLTIMSMFHYPRRVRIVTSESLTDAMKQLET